MEGTTKAAKFPPVEVVEGAAMLPPLGGERTGDVEKSLLGMIDAENFLLGGVDAEKFLLDMVVGAKRFWAGLVGAAEPFSAGAVDWAKFPLAAAAKAPGVATRTIASTKDTQQPCTRTQDAFIFGSL
ncbi:hypothetical protein [Methylobacter sp. sgz302048]|uniref:hypothetical protein n=1 Tax=Methylobacter sp. sgz302048 TaxID=3455945 RepID=UPI003FA040F4